MSAEGRSRDAKRLVIRGRVQGVGYRDAAVQAAFELGVHGWVRNRRDGSVEVLVQGDSDVVGRFVIWCHRGPPLARVAEVASDEVEIDVELRTFETRATA
jgi:acylphosphatase